MLIFSGSNLCDPSPCGKQVRFSNFKIILPLQENLSYCILQTANCSAVKTMYACYVPRVTVIEFDFWCKNVVNYVRNIKIAPF